MDQQYFSKIKDYLQMTIASPLEFYCPETEAEDWDNVPETSAKIILYLKKHQEAVVQYLNQQLKLEQTKALRAYCEDRMTEADKRVTTFQD